MKHLMLTIALGFVLGSTYSCNSTAKEENEDIQTESNEETHDHDHSEHEGLQLNNGERWEANQETTAGVENMSKLLSSFTEKDNVQAYKKLTEDMNTEFSMIFEKCTMTGDAHVQLHNFLIPIKGQLETLESTNLEECKESFAALSEHLKEYKKYFK